MNSTPRASVSPRPIGKDAVRQWYDEMRHVHRSIYENALETGDLGERCRAALAVGPAGSYISHHTAGQFFGMWVPDSAPIHLSVLPGGRRALSPGLAAHRGHHEADRVRRSGILVSTPRQVTIELARFTTLVQQVRALDSVVNRGLDSVEGLTAYAKEHPPGTLRYAKALELIDPKAESAQETSLRLLMKFGGIPSLPSQCVVPIDGKGLTYRLDFGDKRLRIAAEYDGRYHQTPEQRAIDRVRRRWLAERGWLITVVTSDDLYYRPLAILTKLADRFEERGLPRPLLRPEWRDHFQAHRHPLEHVQPMVESA
jgi:very-short-patch-repair endonuclease